MDRGAYGLGRSITSASSVSVNDVRVTDPLKVVSDADLAGGLIKLSHGRKKHVLVRPA